MLWRPRISLLSLLLLTTLACVGLAWWIDRTRRSEKLYVHLITPSNKPDMFGEGVPPVNVPAISVHILVGEPFSVATGHDGLYELSGVVRREWTDGYKAEFAISTGAPFHPTHVATNESLGLDILYPLEDGNGWILLSRSEQPPPTIQHP